MKTILNLIITTFGVLFILSACGGGGVTVGLVNQTCTKNVFSLDCGTSGQATRTTTITDCVKDSGDCADNIPEAVQTCLTDLFGDDCDAVAETIASRTSVTVAELRMTFCEANKADDNCQTTTPDPNPEPTLAEVCMGNPFNTRCLTEYNEAREIACRGEDTTGLDCTATITRYCETEATPTNGNTLNSLCADVKYNTPRETACQMTAHAALCGATITRFCETEAVATLANLFNPLCATYDTARENACRTGNHDSLCDDTITRFCETDATPQNGNTLNSLCVGMQYNAGREAACRTGNHDSLCPATITRYCETDATSNPDNTFNSLCDNNNLAKMVRNSFCMDTGNNNANPFSMRCVENAEAVNIRNNHCGMGAENGATATAFTDMRCVDDTKGLEVRDAYCVIGGDDLATGNAFKPECVHSPAGNAIVLASSECMDTTADSYPLGDLNTRGCLPTVERICKAGVALFDMLCGDAITERCSVAAGWLYEPLCAGDDYQVRRENACLGQQTEILINGCRDTVYLRFCGAGSENPFDTGAGATGMINCLALDNSRRYGVQDYVGFRQRVCGNSRPVPSSKFETECNSLITGLCTADAFDQTAGAANYNCYTDGAFDMQRDTVRIGCSVGTAAATDPNCFDLATLEPCTRDPLRDECDPEEFKEARIARISYCEGVPSELSTEFAPQALCATYSAPFCLVGPNGETDPRFNPLTPICPQSGLSSLAQLAYCSIGNRWNNLAPGVEETRCRNAGRGCLDNPFGRIRAGVSNLPICGTNPVFFGLAAISNRVKFCSGDVAEADLNLCTFKSDSRDSNTQDMLCMSSGRYANPFVDLCAGVEHDAKRATFLDRCQNDIPALGGATSCGFVMSCMENPYGEDCIYHRPYFMSRWTIADECASLEPNVFTDTCTEAIRNSIQACIDEPYEGDCKDNRDYASRRTARVNECAGYGSSAEIRAGGPESTNELRCRVAIDDFCAGDKLFTTDPDGVECFNDDEYGKGSYLADRNMHLAECQKAANARAPRTVCTEVAAHICVSGESEYTNPFLPVCDEDGRSSLVPRQELIKRCQPLDTTTRAEMGNEGCEIVKANMILTNCDDNPFHADCTDYSGAGQAYFDERTARVMACGVAVSETGARCDGTQARLCVSDTTEAAPLSPACNNVADIAGIRNDFLEDCEDGSDVLDCTTTFATAVKTACDADPYDSAVTTIGAASVDCNDFAFYNMPRDTRLTACESDRHNNNCAETINIICLGDGEDVNPFNAALCNGVAPDLLATAKRDFCQIRANVGPASGTVTKSDCTAFLGTPTTATLLRAQTTELNAAPDETNRKNEFLKGTDTGVNTGGLVQKDGMPLTVFTLDLANDGYDNVPFGGEAADGLAYFAGRPVSASNTEPHFYGAIFAGTDLGEPLVQETGVTVDWYGRASWIVVDSNPQHPTTGYNPQVSVDFVLRVDLDNMDIDAHLSLAVVGFTIDASYDDKGVISGDVTYGLSDGSALTRTFFSTGKVIGLIGEQGAVAVFSAYTTVAGTEASVGGFVARAPHSDFFSWTRYAVDPADAPLTIRSIADAGDGEASFIRGGATALNVGADGVTYTLTLADDYSKADSQNARFGGNIVTLGGEAGDGVSFAVNAGLLYSGLLSGTDLGAPLTASATYQGRIGILIHKDGETTYDVDNEFTLNANFTGSFVNSFANLGGESFMISGAKFNQFGLISGRVTLGTSSGTLSGLIGAEGVVGSFISTDHTGGAFAGGFVARANTALTDLAPRLRETLVWRDNAVTDDGTPLNVLAGGTAVDSGNPPTNFIVGGTGALELGNTAVNPKQYTLKADDSFTSTRGDMVRFTGLGVHGVAFARAVVLSPVKWYAGLLSGTRLTNPVSHTAASAQWVGQFGLIRDGLNNNEPYIAPFVLNVDFKGRRIYTSSIRIPSSVLTSGASGEFVFSGNYDGHGIIRGTVGYKNIATGGVETDFAGTLTGLIGVDTGGAETAIGAFVSDSGTGAYAGGFVAREKLAGATITEKVAYGDWVHSFDDPPPAKLNTATPRNQFLAGEFDRLNLEGATSPQPYGISVANSNATFDGIALVLDRNDGVAFFEGDVDGTGYFYAGILSDTDLGAPVGLMFNNQPTGRWNGRFGYRTPVTYYEDFTLEIDFANSSIEAFVEGRDGNYFHLNGGYDANGAITDGTVDYGTFNADSRVQTATRTPNGVLTGIIGEQGAIGAFISNEAGNSGYAGGFVAVPNAGFDPVVKYSDWARSFATLPPNRLDTITRHNQFLGTVTGATKLDDTMIVSTTDSRKVALTLPDAPADGVGFIWDNSGVAGYAGILSSTNLGAPLSQANGKAEWEGTFQALVGAAGANDMDITRDFVLEINFANPNTVEAFVQQAGDNYYHLTGRFGANGVITGEVNFGTFSNLALRTPTGNRADNGFLTGLIGEQGAVGAFLSGTGTKDAITAAPGSVFYSGGFVAGPPALDTNMVEYNDWWRSFATLPPRQLDTTTRGNQFLRTVTWENGLNEAGATVQSNGILSLTGVFEDTTLNGEFADRVGFFWDETNQAGYAGIHHTTNLGGRLVQGAGDATVEWAGVFQALNNAVKSDFVLTINFDNPNTISAFVKQAGDNYYHLTGSFDANGVITGKVNYGTFSDTDTPTPTGDRLPNGILTGLIGSDGAVGVFISGTGTKDSITTTDVKYVGGFVASPTAVNTGAPVNYSDWARSFGTPLPTVPDTTATPRNQFLQGSADTLPTTGLTVDGGAVTPLNLAIATFDGIALGGQAADGVGFFVGVKSGVGTANYAGIFNGTDLGAPLVAGSQKAYWNGQFIAVGTFAVNTDFTLEIDFNVNDEVADSVGSIEAFVVQQAGVGYYHLTGTYDDNGVIKGEVDFGNFTAGTRTQDGGSRIAGTLTGLIGSDGAVGAFISERPLTYSGGFVANETVADRVRFIDWTRSFATVPDATPNTTFENQFLQGTANNITATATGLGANSNGTGMIDPTLLDLATATYGADSDMLMGDAKNGVGFFEGYDNASGRYYYAGIFNGADLGAPLTQTSGEAEWKGQFGVVGAGDLDADFTLEVTFGADSTVPGSAGKVEAFVLYEDTFHYHLTGTYDRNGVISGDVVFGKFTNNMKDMLDTSVEASTDGTLNGLIGQAGAIGVFHSDKTGSGGYSGGFVACPYDNTNNRCQQ